MDQNQCNIQHAIEAGKNQTFSAEHFGVPTYVIPRDMKIEALEALALKHQERPTRLEQRITLLSPESFIDYHNRYASQHSTIFVDPAAGLFVSVLDYHQSPTEPAWGSHIAEYKCPHTPEWKQWTKHHNEHMSQENFALFIEENYKQIDEPNPAEMLEIATTLKSKTDVNFKSSIRLDNGQNQIQYEETINGQAGIMGQLEIPEVFKLVIQPFLGSPAYKVEARFRYRNHGGQLKMWYTLITPHLVIEDAVNDVIASVEDGTNLGQLLRGEHPR
ncbi:DUF2303 family protein [Exilibacterium tricleocarpae]|uniref:DUF2303 family protein n=1 Tax=Exilibacterium tricleocarpae TaxID=2591008 RepID=A0A545U6Y8_9GAMM|nr:DUF2303 family protein [Exilibacterium tricleocarpae]TQV85214.1 DUF2303 family protein [Exilibacterium tricleocarpae]